MNTVRVSLVLSLAILGSVYAEGDRFYTAGEEFGAKICSDTLFVELNDDLIVFPHEAADSAFEQKNAETKTIEEMVEWLKMPASFERRSRQNELISACEERHRQRELLVQEIFSVPDASAIFKSLSQHDPAKEEFKKAFVNLRSFCAGLRDAAEQGKGQWAFFVHTLAAMVADADSIGQLFIQLGTKLQGLANMPFTITIPQPLNTISNNNSRWHKYGETISLGLIVTLISYAHDEEYEEEAREHMEQLMEQIKLRLPSVFDKLHSIIMTPSDDQVSSEDSEISDSEFTRLTVSDLMQSDAYDIIDFISGIEASLMKYRLEDVVRYDAGLESDARKSRVISVYFVRNITEILIASFRSILNGNKPDTAGLAQAFIKCGKELEGIS